MSRLSLPTMARDSGGLRRVVRLSKAGTGLSVCGRLVGRSLVSLSQFWKIEIAYSAATFIRGAKAYRWVVVVRSDRFSNAGISRCSNSRFHFTEDAMLSQHGGIG